MSGHSLGFELVAGPYTFIEGPVGDGSRIIFTDMRASRILAYDPSRDLTDTLHDDSETTNGLTASSTFGWRYSIVPITRNSMSPIPVVTARSVPNTPGREDTTLANCTSGAWIGFS